MNDQEHKAMVEACDRWSRKPDDFDSADVRHFINGERNGFFKGWEECSRYKGSPPDDNS